MSKKTIATLIVLSFFSPRLWATDEKIGIDDLPRLVRDRNERVAASRLLVEAAERETGVLGRSFLPEIEGEAGHETFRTGTEDRRSEPYGTIGARLNIFRSGTDRVEEKSKSTVVQAAEAELEMVLRAQLQQARETFWVLSYQREMQTALADAMDRNDAFLKTANRKIGSGLSTGTDRLEFEIHRRELEQDVARLRLEANRAEKSLALLIGSGSAIETPNQIPHDHEDQLVAVAFDPTSHPAARAAQAAYVNEGLTTRQANRWLTPSVDLYTNYSLYTFREREYDAREDRDETVAGGKVSMYFFDGLKSRARNRGATLRAESYAKTREQTERELAVQVETEKEALQRLHELVHSAEEGVGFGERYLKNTLDEYTRGVKNSPDLLGALEKLIEARRRYAEIRLDHQLVKARLLSLIETGY